MWTRFPSEAKIIPQQDRRRDGTQKICGWDPTGVVISGNHAARGSSGKTKLVETILWKNAAR